MNEALILAGGTGMRLGAEIPKQYIEVDGRPVIAYSMDNFFQLKEIDKVRIVADVSWREYILKYINKKKQKEKFSGFSEPGETRQLSIINALKDMQNYAKKEDLVIIHDAARPCLSEELLRGCIRAAKGHDGVLPVLPMKDTVYYSEDGTRISKLLNREQVLAGQAPEVFEFEKYMAANEALLPEKIFNINGSTEPAVLAGMDIVTISGDEKNYKITTPEDLKRFREEMRKS